MRIYITIVLVAALIVTTSVQSQEKDTGTTKAISTKRAVENFIQWANHQQDIGPETKAKIQQLYDSAGPKGDPDLIVRALTLIRPEFHKALRNLNSEKTEKAIGLLKPLIKSKNSYLESNARFFLARGRMQQENYEKAAKLLKHLAQEDPPHTQYKPHSLFRLAICQLHLLQREKALESISTFLRNYPHAPSWHRERAKLVFVQLMTYPEGGLKEVCDLMKYSRRRLKLDQLDETTQKRQQRIVEILDKIIEKAQKQQGQSGGGGQGSGQGIVQSGGSGAPSGNATPSSPANQSQLPGGSSSMGQLGREVRGDPAETWGNMPPKEREKALSHLKSKFPDRYRDLVEQYYKSLQEEE
ncbi:MAG: tetratricopeptide repeat protein [Candidatus Brocadiia bacterium]